VRAFLIAWLRYEYFGGNCRRQAASRPRSAWWLIA
jgi:hypothetical protein